MALVLEIGQTVNGRGQGSYILPLSTIHPPIAAAIRIASATVKNNSFDAIVCGSKNVETVLGKPSNCNCGPLTTF